MTQEPAPGPRLLALGICALDPTRRLVQGRQGDVEISPIAARFLALLAEEPGRIVSRQAFIGQLWAGNHLVGEPALNRVASEVRKALGAATGGAPVIETVHGRGYRLLAREAAAAPPRAAGAWPRGWALYAVSLLTFLIVAAVLGWLIIMATGLVWGLRGD